MTFGLFDIHWDGFSRETNRKQGEVPDFETQNACGLLFPLFGEQLLGWVQRETKGKAAHFGRKPVRHGVKREARGHKIIRVCPFLGAHFGWRNFRTSPAVVAVAC